MKERTRKIFIMIVMAALIVSLMAASFAALTYGRYSGGRRDENSAYEDILDLVGETAFEVSTADELVNAINNGYSYIKVVGDDPTLVVNNNVADVVVNLVLDVNGHKIVRNSRNPLFNVRQSVSVVLVYDSSTDADGGFYNPVGSALQTSGGTLTVGAGVYESGPRTDTSSGVEKNVTATVYSRTERTGKEYTSDESTTRLPKLTKDVYLENNDKEGYLRNDTYLIYTEEENAFIGEGTGNDEFEDGQLYVNAKENDNGTVTSADKFSPICDVASCDFYYYYPVSGTAGTAKSPQTYAVVYGYNDVKALARDEKKTDENGIEYGMASALTGSGLVWPYAAIRSEAGTTHARGGEFKTHFGEENTYSIYSEGGTMTVGLSGESDPPTFQAIGKGVCINMAGTSGNADQTLTIENGEFSSKIGDTIKMSGGEMEVKKGSFTKTDCKKGTGDKQLENQTAIISLTGGTLNVSGTKTGDDTYSVTMTAGSAVTNPDGTVTYSGTLQNVFGIRAEGGTVTTSGCTFNISGDYSAGVLSYNGTINLDDNTVINVTQSETATVLTSAGVSSEQASEDGEHPVKLSGDVTITSNGLGITARGAVNVTEGESTVTTSRGTGIYVNNGSFTVDSMAAITVNSTVKSGYSWATPPGTGSTNPPNIFNGVYVQGGSLVSNGTLNVTFTGVQNESKYNMDISSLGIEWSDLPEIDSRTGKGTRTWEFESDNQSWYDFWEGFNDYRKGNTPDFQEVQQAVSYAVRVEAGGGANTTVTIDSGNITNSVGGGVLVNGGTVTLGETDLKIHAEGDQTINKAYIYSVNRDESGALFWKTYEYTIEVRSAMYFAEIDDPAQNWAYRENQTGGDAVRVEGGELTIEGGEYTSAQGNGIVAVGGKTTINGGTFNGSDKYQVADNNGLVVPAGPAASYAFKVYGGEITVNAGMFGTTGSNASGGFVMGTSAEAPGTAYINGGMFAVSSGKTGGQAGFGVYRYANVTFGQEGTTGNIQVTGLAAGLVLERTPGDSGTTVTINRGTFSSTRETRDTASDGVWYGNGTSKLNITYGEFTGAGRSGIRLDEDPSNNVEIKGGTFKANQGNPISGYFNQVVPSEYGIISGSNTWGSSCTIGQKESRL